MIPLVSGINIAKTPIFVNFRTILQAQHDADKYLSLKAAWQEVYYRLSPRLPTRFPSPRNPERRVRVNPTPEFTSVLNGLNADRHRLG